MKSFLLRLWQYESQIRGFIVLARFFHYRVPLIGRIVAMLVDRLVFILYNVDLTSSRVDIARLSISHPAGVLLGGNGIRSPGRVVVMSGVKFIARKPNAPDYLAAHQAGCVFKLGDNVVLGVGTTVVGPIEICDNVIVGAMSLVNRSISESGTYVGIPARKISDEAGTEWVAHL